MILMNFLFSTPTLDSPLVRPKRASAKKRLYEKDSEDEDTELESIGDPQDEPEMLSGRHLDVVSKLIRF